MFWVSPPVHLYEQDRVLRYIIWRLKHPNLMRWLHW